MTDTTIGIQEDLDAIAELLDELGQYTPAELRDALGLCTQAHIHTDTCSPRFRLISYIHGRMSWGPVSLRTTNTAYIQYGLPRRDSTEPEWRELPWPPALHGLFFH